MSARAEASTSQASLVSKEKIPIKELVVTQYGYRQDSRVEDMIHFVRHGGEFSAKPPIALFELDDGRLYIHDGHHRSMAIFLSGRDCLLPSEYVLTKHTFDALQSVNFDVGYVTPYDPRAEMRLSDFGSFKKAALFIYNDTANPRRTEDALQYIYSNKDVYSIHRRPYDNIPGMIKYLGLENRVRYPSAKL